MLVRRTLRDILLTLITLGVVLLLAPEWTALASEESHLQSIVGLHEYDFLVWESGAFVEKGKSLVMGNQQYLDEQVRKQVVIEYLEQIREARQLENELNRIYGDPDVADPESESKALQEQLEATRRIVEGQQLLAEAILQEQVGAILQAQGFDLLGIAWPPVLMHMTEVPSLLVISPRDRIEKIHQVTLEHGLSTPQKEALENSVTAELDHSALVVPLGGIGTYPAMIVETDSINRLAEVVTHEWAHHWLSLRPIGIGYALDPNLRIINETVASLVDQELGQMVVERYYPELLPEPVQETSPEKQPNPDPPPFDFSAELANIRIGAEKLLSEGRIDEAEAYMESSRREFLANGYFIRKLNQAYFAFYGAYAAEPGGAQGENPIGPMLRDIRTHTPTIKSFLETVAPITSFEDLQEVHGRVVPPGTDS